LTERKETLSSPSWATKARKFRANHSLPATDDLTYATQLFLVSNLMAGPCSAFHGISETLDN
jgi:hypothetical protein